MTDIESKKNGKTAPMPFLAHLEELRRRLLKSIVAVIVGSMVAFYFSDSIMQLIKQPLGDMQLYNIAVTGSFYAYIKVSLVTGVVAALPIIFYQMWSFISPGLFKRERVLILPLVASSTFLFVLGGAFCFIVVLPLSFAFLTGFSGDVIINNITIGSYISFAGMLMLAFGFGFQMPIVAYFLGKVGFVTSRMLSKGRRYAVIVILVIAAIITPPDVLTQFLLGVPLYMLYEISIIVVKITGRRESQEDSGDDQAVEVVEELEPPEEEDYP